MTTNAPAKTPNGGGLLDRLRGEINGVFDRALGRHRGRDGENLPAEGDFWTSGWPAAFLDPGGPRVDVEETADEVVVTAEMPGLAKDDFKVEVVQGSLRLTGEKKHSREEKKGDAFYSERSYGSFSRTIALPCEVEDAKADARLKDGVLRLRLPKSKKAKAATKRIEVR